MAGHGPTDTVLEVFRPYTPQPTLRKDEKTSLTLAPRRVVVPAVQIAVFRTVLARVVPARVRTVAASTAVLMPTVAVLRHEVTVWVGPIQGVAEFVLTAREASLAVLTTSLPLPIRPSPSQTERMQGPRLAEVRSTCVVTKKYSWIASAPELTTVVARSHRSAPLSRC